VPHFLYFDFSEIFIIPEFQLAPGQFFSPGGNPRNFMECSRRILIKQVNAGNPDKNSKGETEQPFQNLFPFPGL